MTIRNHTMLTARKFQPRRAVVFDFHTMHSVPDVGRDFNPAEFGSRLAEAGVDFVLLPARCNRGFAYYPTQVGIRHPALKIDLFGKMLKACRARGIMAAAYINGGIDHEHALRHREWCKVDKEGRVYQMERMGHFFRNPCLNTGYGTHLLAMIAEILTRYQVDGLFLDCLDIANPCYGVECVESMRILGLNPLNEDDARAYLKRMTYTYLEKVKRLARARTGGRLRLFFNGLPFSDQPDHIELEGPPNAGWGYDYMPSALRYVRTLAKPFFILTSRFQHGYGDFGGLCPEHSLRFDCLNALANGGGYGLVDALHPRGRLEPAVWESITRVFAGLKALDPWTGGARAGAEIAVLDPALKSARAGGGGDIGANMRGAVRMLWELKQQFDVIDDCRDIGKYRLIVLPDSILLNNALKAALSRHLKKGGAIISSGASGLDLSKNAFALRQYNCRYRGPEPFDPAFFRVKPPFNRDIPDMPIAIYEPGIAFTANRGADILAELMKPYFNRGEWDGSHENVYIPPDRPAGRPALIRSGRIIHFSFPVFAGYYQHAAVYYRNIFRNCLQHLLPAPILKVNGLPPSAQATVTSQKNRRIVHLLAYQPELRGKAQVVEDPLRSGPVALALRADTGRVRSVYLAPSSQKLPFEKTDGYWQIEVPEVNGYQMIVFEH